MVLVAVTDAVRWERVQQAVVTISIFMALARMPLALFTKPMGPLTASIRQTRCRLSFSAMSLTTHRDGYLAALGRPRGLMLTHEPSRASSMAQVTNAVIPDLGERAPTPQPQRSGIAPCSVELYEAVVAVNDVKRPSQFGQERDCWSPFRSERPARATCRAGSCL